MNYLAHAEEIEEAANGGLLDSLRHLPTWSALLVVAFLLFGIYVLLEKLNVNVVNRILLMLPLLILIGIFYLQENTVVTTSVLSLGFVAAFFLAFALMTGGEKEKGKPENHAGKD